MIVHFFDKPYLLYYNDYRFANEIFKNDFYVIQHTVGWPRKNQPIVVIHTKRQTEDWRYLK